MTNIFSSNEKPTKHEAKKQKTAFEKAAGWMWIGIIVLLAAPLIIGVWRWALGL